MALSESARRGVADAKVAMDNVVSCCKGTRMLEECEISDFDVTRMSFALADVIRDEGISYGEAGGNAFGISVGHWSEVDSALKFASDALRDTGAMDEIRVDYPEAADTIDGCIDSFGIDY